MTLLIFSIWRGNLDVLQVGLKQSSPKGQPPCERVLVLQDEEGQTAVIKEDLFIKSDSINKNT